ncbi:MAG: type ISP restriction/modification enzyme, partial [Chloroflexales bacterium]
MTPTAVPLFAPGTIINTRYELHSMLDRGGMGEVYQAHDRFLNRPIALKVMLPGMDAKRFVKEAQAQAQFTHDALLTVWDVGVDAITTTPFFTMPLMHGSLESVVHPPLAPAEVVAWLTPVAEGLDYLHGRGLIHRDLKPANLLVTPEGKIKLADFGLIKDLSLGLTASRGWGTPMFMAPEQIELKQISPATDVYALGVIAYLLLTAQYPYKSPVDCLAKKPKALRRWIASIPPTVEAVVLKALARQPAHRYASAGAFIADLAAALAPAPSVSVPIAPATVAPVAAGTVTVVVAAKATLAAAVTRFLDQVEKDVKHGHATEHTYRPYLKALCEACVQDLVATNEPKRIAAGAPDLWLTVNDLPVGHIEAKDVGSDLAKMVADSEKSAPRSREGRQLARYRAALPRLLLTDCLEWRWFAGGAPHPATPIRLATWDGAKLHRSATAVADFTTVIQAFFQSQYPAVNTPAELAARMAHLGKLLNETTLAALQAGTASDNAYLIAQRDVLRDQLLPGLDNQDFADLYAQTIAYGLFAARVTALETPGMLGVPFTLQQAAFLIPPAIPFLRRFFSEIAGPSLDERVAWIVEDLVRLLDATDIGAVMHGFGTATKQTDVVIHFYETFLDAYNPELRKERGVYYTPDAVISYLVRSVDLLLKTHFQREEGLLDESVQILDPATGTGTFLASVIRHVYAMLQHTLGGAWKGYVKDKLLPRLYGFEVLMAPYTIAHLRLTTVLRELKYAPSDKERLNIYLTNTLADDPSGTKAMAGFGMELTRESQAAYEVKQHKPVLVVLGNPPYSGHSQNTGEWISGLLDDYKQVDGAPLGERNPKWLQNDYVKFIRFAQWRIERSGHGIVAYITDNSYLDGPTFRGMRQSLINAFDHIYILNLHGNSKRKERAPGGGADENVFNIQQGVAIVLLVRKEGEHTRQATVHYTDLWGRREEKYQELAAIDVTTTAWETLAPSSPMYLFIAQDITLRAEYERGWKLTDVFPVNVLGFQTHRDHFAVDLDLTKLRERITALRNTTLSDDQIRERYVVQNNRDWEVAAARSQIRADFSWEKPFTTCLYRPFDSRHCYYSNVAMDYPRRQLVTHMLHHNNLCLLSSRQQATPSYKHCWVADAPANDCVISTTSREANQVFLLYTYPPEQQIASGLYTKDHREANLSKEFVGALAAATGLTALGDGRGDGKVTFGPEDVFHYIYAILHSPSYRARYEGFLKADFPRIPLPPAADLFWTLAAKGAELVDLHLLRSTGTKGVGGAGGVAVFGPAQLGVNYLVSGSDEIERVRYDPPSPVNGNAGWVYIN